MARDITPASADIIGVASLPERSPDEARGGSGALKGAAEAVGTFCAAIAGFAIGGLEAWTDRRADARSARLRSRAASGRRLRAPSATGDARRGVRS